MSKLGNFYEDGYAVEQNYHKAKEYYEQSSKLNNSDAFIYLGQLYENGYGVPRNYNKALECYEHSHELENPKASFHLGQLYEKGHGVPQDYNKAKEYYEQSSKLNDATSHFYLGDFYSNSDIFPLNLEEAIDYFKKSIQIEAGFQTIQNKKDGGSLATYQANNYRYISYNDLGLIYLLEKNEIDEARNNLKESAFAEYPFGQNNLGLFYQIYLKENGNAEHMFERSSKHNFSLAEFNLGMICEKENRTEESIEYFERASEHEKEPLKYRDITRHDKRLEISKTFIICFTNLKLSEYFLSHDEYEKSRKYFIKAINNLQIDENPSKYQFEMRIKINSESEEEYWKDTFSFIKRFILNFPLFNLKNQPNLNLNNYSNLFNHKEKEIEDKDENINEIEIYPQSPENEQKKKQNELVIKLFSYEEKCNDANFKKFLLTKGKSLNYEIEEEQSRMLNEYETRKRQEKSMKVIKDPGDLFDFIIERSNSELESEFNLNTNPESDSNLVSNSKSKIEMIFIEEIKDIIKTMKNILYTPPYSILFGRISIFSPKTKSEDNRNSTENNNQNQRQINESFYEGFGIP